MNIVLDRLEAVLPAQSAVMPDSFVANPRALRAWLDGPPPTDRLSALLRLLQGLREFNAALMAPRQRLAMLEIFERSSAALVDDVKNEVREFFPLSFPRIEEVQIADRIGRELGVGYTSVACGLATRSGTVPLLRRGLVAQALVRASACQKGRLWLSCRMLGPPNEGVWRSLHDLFAFAVSSGCADRESTLALGGTSASARSIYTQALLLAFAKPNRFTQAQNRQLHTSLPVLASWCEIRSGGATGGVIAVSVESDLSPPALPPGMPDVEHLALDVRRLVAQFDALLTGIDGAGEIVLHARRGGGTAILAPDLVEALKSAWSGYTERGSPRSEGRISPATRLGDVARGFERGAAQARVETEIGLARVHACLAGYQDPETASRLAGETSLPAASWTLLAPGGSNARRACAEVMDHSERGYRLRWKPGQDARARVGELIALAPVADGERQWRYGALRWLRTQCDAAVDAGVELFASPVPVEVCALDANGITLAPVRGILVGVSPDGKPAARSGILVPRPFASDVSGVELLRVGEADADAIPRPVRVAKFAVHDAGLYQKIVLSDEAIERVVG